MGELEAGDLCRYVPLIDRGLEALSEAPRSASWSCTEQVSCPLFFSLLHGVLSLEAETRRRAERMNAIRES